ncbi:hypothetical protein Z043_112165, partial [Scleropages formosus]
MQDSDGASRPEAPPPPPPSSLRPARVVSSTSEEEEALTEKFLKINCKYITDGKEEALQPKACDQPSGVLVRYVVKALDVSPLWEVQAVCRPVSCSSKGAVSGVLLITPNNIMFDPHRTDPLVQERGCEEYGIMCPLEEVVSAAVYREITDSKVRESVPQDVERDTSQPKRIKASHTDEAEFRLRDTGNDSGSTAPRSTEESFSEDVFTESELSPIREELVSSDELRQDKSSGASSESVLTVHQEATADSSALTGEPAGDGQEAGEQPGAAGSPEGPTSKRTLATGSRQHSAEQTPGTPPSRVHRSTSEGDGAQEDATKEMTQDSEADVEELRKMWKSHTMQQTKEQRENVHMEVTEGQVPTE